MRRWIYMGVMVMVATPGEASFTAATPGEASLMAPARLQALVEGFAGRPALVDPRLLLPSCAAPELAWAGSSVMVRCAVPDWQVFVPVVGSVAAVADTGPVIRRGDRVVVEAGGDGFVIGMETVAEADSRDGRVALRVAGGGRRLTGIVGGDGRVRINGLNAMVNGR
nr:hypothetical protein [Polymorphobacter sp.]